MKKFIFLTILAMLALTMFAQHSVALSHPRSSPIAPPAPDPGSTPQPVQSPQ